MNKELSEELKKKIEQLVSGPPFNGTVTHRTRPIFIAEWKKYLKEKGINGSGYIDDLLRAFGKKGHF